jgi:D-alanyl-D-alanine carboxypeptidase
VGGTTASLCEGDQVSVRDLLYGLMLPSGNDAAVTLAENFGDYQEDDNDEEDQEALAEFRRNKKMNCHHTDYFLSQMNLWAKRFGLSNTYYANPHGTTHGPL